MTDPRFDENDARVVIRDLRSYERRFRALMDEIADTKVFAPHERQQLMETYTALKEDLKERHRHFNLVSVDRELNPTEHAFLSPALREAYVGLTAPVNSHPTKWYSCLYSSHLDINHLLRQLVNIYPDTEPQG